MVLRLKTRESRSLPGLLNARSFLFMIKAAIGPVPMRLLQNNHFTLKISCFTHCRPATVGRDVFMRASNPGRPMLPEQRLARAALP